MKGDTVKISFTTPGGADGNIIMTVGIGGRSLRLEKKRDWTTVREVTRGGTIVRQAQVRTDTVMAIETEGDVEME